MSIEPGDVLPLLEEVASFARERVAEAASRPECPMTAAAHDRLTGDAREIGLLPAADGLAGLGLWEHCNHGHAMAFNIGLLQHVAGANVGTAFAWHRYSLACAVTRDLGHDAHAGTFLVPVGHIGLARTALPRWLNGADLDEAGTMLLADWLDRRDHATMALLPASWEAVLWPVWVEGCIEWQRAPRTALDVVECRPQHGMDELRLMALTARTGPTLPSIAARDARAVFARMLKLDMIGLLAIGAGGLRRGEAQASAYAADRRQGGRLIARHPAVHRMLGEIAMARQSAEGFLDACARPVDELDVGVIAAGRAVHHSALCRAADMVMQVHGGIGYMRDVGAEKLLRDMNMLKLQAGGTREIPSFLAGWHGARE